MTIDVQLIVDKYRSLLKPRCGWLEGTVRYFRARRVVLLTTMSEGEDMTTKLSWNGLKRKKDSDNKRVRQYKGGVASGYNFGSLVYVFVCFGFISLTLSGCCGGLDKAQTFNSVQEAGSVHVSALSISRWDYYVNSLQPQFTMTPDLALALALPRTSISQNSVAEIVSGGLQIGLPQSTQSNAITQALTQGLTSSAGNTSNAGTSTSSGTTTANGNTTANASTSSTGSTATTSTTTTNGNQTTTQTTTTQQGPGILPPNLLPSVTQPNAATATGPSGTVQIDPILTYTAATAIYQEVQLLNAYVKDAVLRYGYTPYLARVQIAVIPFARKEPYDVYVNLGMFSRCANGDDEAPVVVIPLLVTDDVETGQATNTLNVARQLALSLGGMVSNVALQAGLSDLKDQFKAILGTDFNSLYMVTRGGDNVVQVRLGAARNPNLEVGYGMLTQTHNVSLLLLVDHNYSPDEGKCSTLKDGDNLKAGPQVWINSFSRFRNANTGEELPVKASLLTERARKLMERFLAVDIANNLDRNEDIIPLLVAMQQNEMDLFKKSFSDLLCRKTHSCGNTTPAGIAESLWTGLTSIVNMSEYAGTFFELPKKKRLAVDAEQTVLLHDNCKDATTAMINGFTNLSPSQFTAALTLKNNIRLSAMITQSTLGGPFTLQFPSLHTFVCSEPTDKKSKDNKDCYCQGLDGIKNSEQSLAWTMPLHKAELTIEETVDNRWINEHTSADTCPYKFTFRSLYVDGSSPSNTNIAILSGVDTLTVDATGKSQLRLFLTTKGFDDVVLSFSGATLATPLPTNATAVEKAPQPAASLKVALATDSSTNVVDVNLQGGVATRTISVTAVGRKKVAGVGDPKPVAGAISVITIPFIAPSSTKQAGGAPTP